MTTAIPANSAATITSVHMKRADLESTSTLKTIREQLSSVTVTNKATLLRLKTDDSGHARLKLMPERQSFLTKMFSGVRYAKEAARASEYFGLTGKATAGAALSKTNPLTDTLVQTIEKPLEVLTPFELGQLQEKLSHLNGKAVLQVDTEGKVRTARPRTDKEQVDLARRYFGLEGKPTVASVRSTIQAILSESMLKQERKTTATEITSETEGGSPETVLKEALSELSDMELHHLQLSLARNYNDDLLTLPAGKAHAEMQITAILARCVIANEVLRRKSGAADWQKNPSKVRFDPGGIRIHEYPKTMSPSENTSPVERTTPGDEVRPAFGNAAGHHDIASYLTIIDSMHQDGSDAARVLSQVSQELCAGNYTVDAARQYASEQFWKLSPEIRTDLTELIIVAHTAYLNYR
ncbi:MAG TPA: hypothetical protein VGO76_15675 [Luteibacter sp.]|nr:hypothetical protein [Luteibacter sp.]